MLKRMLTILVAVPVIFLCTYFGGIPFFILVTALAIVSLNEFYNLLKSKGLSPYYTIGNLFTLLIIILVQFTLKHPNWEPVSSALLTLAVITNFTAAIFVRRTAMATANIATTLLGMLYVGWLFSYLVLLRALTPHGAYLFFLMITIWAADTVAFLVGTKLGKRQLSPYISPKKTVEGAVIGFIVAVIASFIFGIIKEQSLLPVNYIHYIILGAIIGIFAQISDLSESIIKRDAGVKDSSNLVPGHGGVLDRMDSFIFTAPVVYYYLIWFVIK